MLSRLSTRESISAVVIFFYLIPLIAITSYSLWLPDSKTWGVFSLGLLLATFGTLALYSIIASWQDSVLQKNSFSSPMFNEQNFCHEDELTSNDEIKQKNVEIQCLIEAQDEFRDDTQKSIEVLTQENQSLADQITHKENLLEQSELTIAELRITHDRKQQRINQLETKVRDLSYEIKTLLQLTEIPDAAIPEKPIRPIQETAQAYSAEIGSKPKPKTQTGVDAAMQLKRCIDIAQKMTGASHYSSSNSRFRGIPVDSFALDLRCLFDSLRSENSCTVLFYSPKENKLLFANDQTRKLTGWSPEKFVQNFDHIIQEGSDEWKNAIKQLSSQSESKVRLILRSRSGEDTLIHGLLGTIPTGIFRHHIIAILFNADHRHALSSNT